MSARPDELFSANNEPSGVLEPLFKLLEGGAQGPTSLLLNRANLTIRSYPKPTKADVLASVDALESMAFTFYEEGDCYGDLESAFERLRHELNRAKKPTHEEAAQCARAAWYGEDL